MTGAIPLSINERRVMGYWDDDNNGRSIGQAEVDELTKKKDELAKKESEEAENK